MIHQTMINLILVSFLLLPFPLRCNAFSPHQRHTINQPLKSKCVDCHTPNNMIEESNVTESSARRSVMQSLLLGLVCSPTSTQAKDILKKGTMIEVKDPDTYSGLVYQPLGALDPDRKSKYPILFVLHGAGKNTEDTWNLANSKGEHAGLIPSLIADGTAPKELYDNFIVVAPYSKDKASFYDEPRSKLLQYMRFVINADGGGKQGVVTDSLDLDRKFLFGFSDGATLGVELMTTRKFQGGIFCAYGFTGTLPSLALERLKGLPMWIYHSADDGE